MIAGLILVLLFEGHIFLAIEDGLGSVFEFNFAAIVQDNVASDPDFRRVPPPGAIHS